MGCRGVGATGGFSLAWFAGARRDLLALCVSEATFYNGLGLTVVATAFVSAVTLAVALGYVLRVPAVSLWPVALVWGVIICNIDRLLVMMTASRRLFLAVLPRVAMSLVIGVMIAEVLMLWFYQPEINGQLQVDVQRAVQASTARIDSFYAPRISADQQAIAGLEAQENSLTAEIDQDRFLSSCEAGDVTCSTTHRTGCGAYCAHYAQLATSAQAQLDAVTPSDNARIQALTADASRLGATETADEQAVTSREQAATGLIAREDALAELEHAHPGIDLQVWFIRIALVLLDLMPLVIKTLHIAFGDSAYERIAAADRRRDGLHAHRIDLATRVEKGRQNLQALADEEVNGVVIEVDRERRIAEAEGRDADSHRPRTPPGHHHRPTGRRIEAPSLGDFVSTMRGHVPHESMAVPVPSMLRLAGWVGTGLVAAVALGLAVYTTETGRLLHGEWLAALVVVATASLAAFTRGFRRAPAWALRGTFAVLLVGLGLPVLLASVNLS